jgi:hypothetical protein
MLMEKLLEADSGEQTLVSPCVKFCVKDSLGYKLIA